MRKTILVCDCCGKQQGADNHWLRVRILSQVRAFPAGIMVELLDGAAHGLTHDDAKEVCGKQCAIKTVSEMIDGLR